jgi:hypothetical protein
MLEFENEEQQDDERLSPGFLEELHNYMDKEEVKELNINITEDDSFQIVNKEQAGFFIRKIQEARQEAEEINENANKEIERISNKVNAWREQELSKCASTEAYILNLLKNFAEKELSDTDKRSIKLPFGTLAFKKQQDKFDYDDAALLQCLENNKLEDYIQRKPSVKKAELKKTGTVKDGKLYIDGVLIEGIVITPQDDKFEVK